MSLLAPPAGGVRRWATPKLASYAALSGAGLLTALVFARPELVEAIYYPNAYHSFDSKMSDRTLVVADGKSHRLAYDAAAGPDAEARTKAFFDKLLRP